METRFRILFLNIRQRLLPALILLLACTAVRAELVLDQSPIIKPEIDRREVSEAKINVDDYEIGAYVGVLNIEDFGSDIVYSVRLAYHITEDVFVEAAIGYSEAGKNGFETLTGFNLLSNRDFIYYHLSAGYNILPGEAFVGSNRAYNSALYLIGGLGVVEFNDDSFFSLNVGAGYRVLLNDSVALHITARDYMFDFDLLGEDKLTHNLELTAGISFFF